MLVVFPVYKRLDALKHFKHCYDSPKYGSYTVYISLEGGASDTVKDYVESIQFEFLQSIVRCFDKRQGLKRHILQCGDLVQEFGHVLIIEDDLLILPGWDEWCNAAVGKLNRNSRLDSASLYRYSIDEARSIPLDLSIGEEYNSQYASSWGQIWTLDNWKRFRLWLAENELNNYKNLPNFINSWSVNSWKKHYIAYLVENDLYCLYPIGSFICHTSSSRGTNLISNSFFRTYYNGNELVFPEKLSDIYFDANWSRRYEVILDEKSYWTTYKNGLHPEISGINSRILAAGFCRDSIAQWDIIIYPLNLNTLRPPENKSKWGLHLIESNKTVHFSKAFILNSFYADRLNSRTSILFIGLILFKILRRLLSR